MDHKRVATELTHGKKFAMQLKIHLDNPSSSREFQEALMQNILLSYYKSLNLLTTPELNPNGTNEGSNLHAGMGSTRTNSQVSFSETQCKEHLDRESSTPNHHDLNAKRKGHMQKWKNQVQIRGDMGIEEALDDGYNWRKYGQKDIFGAKHPRGYYKCAYRQLQGCLATKQVQKLDEDPSIFDITYLGSHTCNLEFHTTSTPDPSPLPKQEILQPSLQNQYLQSSQTLSTVQRYPDIPLFHCPSSSNNMLSLPILNNTYDCPRTSRSTHQPSATRYHTVDVGFSFGDGEFANNNNFDDSIFYD